MSYRHDDSRPAQAAAVSVPLTLRLVPAWARYVMTVFAVGAGALFLVGPLFPGFWDGRTSSTEFAAWIATGLGCLVFAWRWFRCSLVVDDAGLLVRNLLRSRRLVWSDLGALRDGSFQDEGGLQWILVIQDRQDRVIKPLASMGHPNQDSVADLLTQLARRHGVNAELSPFPKTLGASRPKQAGWFPDPLARHPMRYFDGHGWSNAVAVLDESGAATRVELDPRGLPVLAWLPLGHTYDGQVDGLPPEPPQPPSPQQRAARRRRTQLIVIGASVAGLAAFITFFTVIYPGSDPLNGTVGGSCLFAGLFGVVALPWTLIVLLRDRARARGRRTWTGPTALLAVLVLLVGGAVLYSLHPNPGFHDVNSLDSSMKTTISARAVSDGPGVTVTHVSCVPTPAPDRFICQIFWTDDTAITATVTVSHDGTSWVSKPQ